LEDQRNVVGDGKDPILDVYDDDNDDGYFGCCSHPNLMKL
jgi:hypothetical protein